MVPPRLRTRPPLLVGVLLVGACGCTVDRSGLGGSPATDASSRADGARDAAADRRALDARAGDAGDGGSFSCRELANARRLATLDARSPGEGFLAEGVLDALEVDERGSLVLPHSPHRHGVLLATGYPRALLDTTMPTLDDVDDIPRGRAFFGGAFVDLVLGGPQSLGLQFDGSYTVLFEGQVRLEAGPTTVQLTANDRAVLSIGGLPEGDLTIQATTEGATEERTVGVDAAGWYDLRVAMSNGFDSSLLDVRITDQTGVASRVGADRIRVDASGVAGRELVGWNTGETTATPDGAYIDQASSLRNFSAGVDRAGVSSFDGWSLRWIGRCLLDESGAAIQVDTDDSHRLWVDGVYLGGNYGGGPSQVTYPLALVPGWYDVVLELEDQFGAAHAHLRYGGGELQPERMRPRTRFGGLAFGRGTDAPFSVGAHMSEDLVLSVAAPDANVTGVDLSVVVDAPSLEGVNVDVTGPSPGGPRVLGLLDEARRVPVANQDLWWGRITASSRLGSSGAWRFDVSNGSDAEVTVRSAGVLVHTGGAVQPYGTRGTFTSSPIHLPDVARVERLEVHQQVPHGTFVDLSARAAGDEAGLAERDFVAVGPDFALDQAVEGRVVQVRAVLRGDGRDTPRLGRIGIVGRLCLCEEEESCPEPRTDEGLVVLYTFDERSGSTVQDRSGSPDALDLELSDPARGEWGIGSLALVGPTLLRSAGPATKVIDALTTSGAMTVELWVEPGVTVLPEGAPARLVTVSLDESHRNVTLGQREDRSFEVRVRHATGDLDGAPFLTSGPGLAEERLMHIVYTLDSAGAENLYLDGTPVASDVREPDLSGWDSSYPLALGNELNGGRGWLGAYFLVAIYDRALDEATIRRHQLLGP